MNLSTYKTPHMTQIAVTVEGFNERALLTRFSGSRLWAVRGSFGNDRPYDVILHDGISRQSFLKGTALELAERFIRTGREFL